MVGGKKPEVLGGRYRLIRLIGAGGMGEVHEAIDGVISRKVAVKRILAPFAKVAEIRERFAAEIAALARVQHPSVINITDKGVDANGSPYFVMEYASGRTLKEFAAGRSMSPERAIQIVGRILRGLAAAHAAGVIHRDLKPQNVLVVDDEHVKIVDFGIAKALCGEFSDLTAANAMMGTPGYMAPEVALARGSSHPTVDIFAVGVILYELLAGRLPFDPATTGAGATVPPTLGALPPLPAEVPPALSQVIAQAVEMDPARRFQSAGEFLAALEGIGDLRVMSLVKGDVVESKYVIQEQLGRGGPAVVYLAKDKLIGRTVVLKFLFLGDGGEPDDVLRQRFFQDAALADHVRHPGIVRIHGAGTAFGHPFLVMEHVEGRTLRKASEELDWGGLMRVLRLVAEGLYAVHAANIVHRDVSPENIIVQPDGSPKLLDFGAARRPNSELTVSGAMEAIGRPGYQSPEHAWRPQSVTPASDQWSLAAVVYEVLTGRLPYEDPGSDLEEPVVMNRLIERLLNESQPMAPHVIDRTIPADLSAALVRALARDPGDRFESVIAFADALAEAGEPSIPCPSSPASSASTEKVKVRPAKARIRRWALVVILTLGTLGATWAGWPHTWELPRMSFPSVMPSGARLQPDAPVARALAPEPRGSIKVTGATSDTTITVDGQQRTLPTTLDGPIGSSHIIVVQRQGYRDEQIELTIAGAPITFTASASTRLRKGHRESPGLWDRNLGE
jgi:serine/threonine protein kinase